jgi:hypothetical protein
MPNEFKPCQFCQREVLHLNGFCGFCQPVSHQEVFQLLEEKTRQTNQQTTRLQELETEVATHLEALQTSQE